ncbi:E3 ubiquitin-protein ligase RNF126-A-like isoform X2 [Bacillus rossius redtenbacheri]|uniref:E3 ubiquitin-protein ligase RNF126-A-like isoform X2 n=1 Tax=Bacillus rossius redtenbacheri TaxID=93214 RepID=UPI002FDE4F15
MMAEAVVADPIISKFFCHKCSSEIGRVLPDYTCPNCYSGFIEKIDEAQETPMYEGEIEVDPFTTVFEVLQARNLDQLLPADSGEDDRQRDDRRVLRLRERAGSDSRRPGRIARTRPGAPLENLIREFLVNLTGVGWGTISASHGANGPVFFLGNPGDYAWGREGLDAIVTQLLNQMDGTGPPPLARDKIEEIPVVVITEDQVGKSLQCSVCWDDFTLGEFVRKLKCEHIYHENCIVPWLQLHGTCPICRKSLNDEEQNDGQSSPGNSTSNEYANESPLAAFFRTLHASHSSSSTSSSSSSSSAGSSASATSDNAQSGLGGAGSSQSDYDMELDFE